jgi:hypothetical protein
MELNKTFIAGKMNKDLDERLVPDGEFIDALNVTIDTTSGSNIGAVSNSLGNTLVTNIQQLVEDEDVVYVGSNAKTIGSVTYEADNLIYWLVTSDTFDAIFEYSEIFQFTSIVLLCTQGQLNFNKNYPVTGVNFIPASKGEGPFLYWTDGLNPPRRINISRAKSYVTDDSRIIDDIDVIIKPPLYSPKIDLDLVPSLNVSNNIQDKFIYFSYRFKYKDNQYSSLAPFSSVAFHASGFTYDYNTGDNKGMLNKYNKVDVTFDTGNEFVEEIQVLYFDTYKLNVYIVGNYNKADLGIDDNSKYQIPTFSSNKIYTPLESSEVTRLFDNVPLTAKAQEIIGNRLVYGNYIQFRDIVNASGVKIVPNYLLSLETDAITTEPKKTFRSDRDYEIGIVYLDEYGRMTTALTSKENTLYIPPVNSDTANSIKVTLNNEPPFWATNYRFVIKQAQGDYYNIFPRTFVVDGVFRYFLINESDRDKITVGGYVIFKTADGVATHSNKQFKVLELEYKQATTPFTTEGLYFKIKADPSDTFLNSPTVQTISKTSFGRGPRPGTCPARPETESPVILRSSLVQFEKAYYASNGDNTLIYPFQNNAPDIDASSSTTRYKDERLSVVIVPIAGNPTAVPTHFKYTFNPDTNLELSAEIPIPTVSPFNYNVSTIQGSITLTFDQGNYIPGDIYVFNVRANLITYGADGILRTVLNPYGLLPVSSTGGIPTRDDDTMAGLITDDYGGHAILLYNGPIYQGAAISINILSDTAPDGGDPIRSQNNNWISDNYYRNIEEWFWKSGAYKTFKYKNQADSLVTSAENISFRRSTSSGVQYTGLFYNTNYIVEDSNTNTGLLCILVRGVGDNEGCERNKIEAQLTITQTPTVQLSAETVPLVSDVDLFYEMRKTYRIENGNHMVSWPYADYTSASIIFPTVPSVAGKTVLGPINPNSPTSTDMMHSFNIGEKVWVQNSDTTPPIIGPVSGEYTILYVTNYSIVIDLNFPGTGAATPGKVFYKQFESDQDFTGSPVVPLVVQLNNVTSDNSDFNAFAFGNGVESYRIYDNFLRPTMKYSPRATSVIEDYKQEEKIASLCYSGIYKGDTSTNRLNSFNLSQANFKNLDKQYGPIQKLYALDTNLMVLQQDKITSVLYGKNLLVDAVGGGQVASVPEVLGNQVVHPSEYGISNNPESFAKFSNMIFFTDSRRGAVLQMLGDQVVEISSNGMRNYFRDELKDNPNTQKLGMYDPYNDTYVLSFTDVRQGSCELSINPDFRTIRFDTNGNSYFMFKIESNEYWAITLQDSGSGTDWVNILIDSGYGDQDIYAYVDSNESLRFRDIDFVIEYCDGSTVTFVLIQDGVN